MLPAAYHVPATLFLLLSGTIACFFGYRLFRIVLAIVGFVLGATLARSVFGAPDAMPVLVAAVVGGLVGAAVLVAAYFVGVALVGAALGAVVAHLVVTASGNQPGVVMIVLFAIGGAAASMYLQRYVVIVATSFGGAWTLVLALMAVMGDREVVAAATESLWTTSPLDPVARGGLVSIAWIVLGLVGVAVQLGWTGGENGRVVRGKKK